jgi:uncharacterized membrane protein
MGPKTHDEVWADHPAVRTGDQLTFGERAADRMRSTMGSWTFVFGFFAVMIIWAAMNSYVLEKVLHHKPFDPYPYILLNLFLSMMAGVQAAALLIAAKRSDAIAAEIALHTQTNTEDIKSLLDENTELTRSTHTNAAGISEIHRHITAICDHLGIEAGISEPSIP